MIFWDRFLKMSLLHLRYMNGFVFYPDKKRDQVCGHDLQRLNSYSIKSFWTKICNFHMEEDFLESIWSRNHNYSQLQFHPLDGTLTNLWSLSFCIYLSQNESSVAVSVRVLLCLAMLHPSGYTDTPAHDQNHFLGTQHCNMLSSRNYYMLISSLVANNLNISWT